MSYIFIKSFITKSVVNAYLKKSTYYDEFQSKIGDIVDCTKKRRKDRRSKLLAKHRVAHAS